MLRRSAAVLLALALPALAAAQYDPRYARPPRVYGPPPVGPTISGWVGFALPSGSFDGDFGVHTGDVINNAVPIGVEFAYRFSPMFRAGVFLQGAPVSVNGSYCNPGESCGGSQFELGFEGQLHLAPYRHVDPWVGLGFGYEWLRFDANSAANFTDTYRYSGWIFPRVSGGLDFAVSPVFTLGPYLAYSAGQYNYLDQASAGAGDITNQAYHGWFELGIRGNFNL